MGLNPQKRDWSAVSLVELQETLCTARIKSPRRRSLFAGRCGGQGKGRPCARGSSCWFEESRVSSMRELLLGAAPGCMAFVCCCHHRLQGFRFLTGPGWLPRRAPPRPRGRSLRV
jgi:hypothetical protein